MGDWSTSSGTPVPAPNMPVGVSAAPGYQQLVVSWTASTPNSDDAGEVAVTGHVVQWKADGEDYAASRQATVGAAAESYTITGLANDVEYTVRVFATSAAGNSPAGEDSATTAAAGTPPAAPGNVMLIPYNERLAVSWTEASGGNAVATGYTVRWKETDAAGYAADNVAEGLGMDAREYTITGLANGTNYTVQVRATSAAGNGAWGEQTSTPAPVPEAPGNVMVEPGNAQLVVRWTASSVNADSEGNDVAVTNYKVQWKSGDEDYDESSRQFVATADATSHTITGLANDPETEYTVRVIATSISGSSPPSAEATGTPDEELAAMPDAPGNVMVAAYHERLVVSWTTPADRGAMLSAYTLQWRASDEGYHSNRQVAPAVGDTSYDLINANGIENGTEYVVRIRATNDNGDSDWSAEASGRPAPVPNMPVGVSARSWLPAACGELDRLHPQ